MTVNVQSLLQGDPEFLGRCIVTPNVILKGEAYDPAQLAWHDIFRGTINAGQLLGAFELLEVLIPCISLK